MPDAVLQDAKELIDVHCLCIVVTYYHIWLFYIGTIFLSCEAKVTKIHEED
jgi:hypothetical protein